ncbi:MAG: hypothetical protein KGN80_10915 [Acidobacteriota bacterium]|nr:hypothetical protein [Acidobacteriota bacterium]
MSVKPRAVSFLAALLLGTSLLQAWGDKGHRIVNGMMLQTLPPGLNAWYAGKEDYLRDHASDPDLWRSHDRKEGPRHFLDVEVYGGPDNVPLEAAKAIQQVGSEDFLRHGQLVWVIQDRWKDLAEAFQSGDRDKVALATAVLGHYVGDAHVPLHSTRNHDGQETGQRGVHSRWETGLVERYVAEGDLKVRSAKVDSEVMKAPWKWLRDSSALVPKLLESDRIADRTTPSGTRGRRREGAYWLIFWAEQRESVKHQLEQSADDLGDLVLSAWVRAGKPAAK